MSQWQSGAPQSETRRGVCTADHRTAAPMAGDTWRRSCAKEVKRLPLYPPARDQHLEDARDFIRRKESNAQSEIKRPPEPVLTRCIFPSSMGRCLGHQRIKPRNVRPARQFLVAQESARHQCTRKQRASRRWKNARIELGARSGKTSKGPALSQRSTMCMCTKCHWTKALKPCSASLTKMVF